MSDNLQVLLETLSDIIDEETVSDNPSYDKICAYRHAKDLVSDAIENLKPQPKKKYTLILNMNSDDDVMIEYNDCLYCYYRENLAISEQFDCILDIVYFIKDEIIVHDGYKATDMTKEWLAQCAHFISFAGMPASDICGNQEYSMNIIENK